MYPKPSIKSNSLKERRAAVQLKKWCSLYKQGLLDQSVIVMLTESNCLKWLLPVDLEKESNNKCILLCEFIIKNKKQPSTISKDTEEKRLAQFLQTKRRAASGKGTAKLYQSDFEILKRYNMEYLLKETPESRSNNTCIELCEYIIKNKKYPNKRSKDTEEKRLALFLQGKRQAASGKGTVKLYQSDLDILRRYSMEDLFNETPESRSNETCIELCEYIIKNKKQPNERSKDTEEKTLGSFLKTKRQAAYGKGKTKLYQSDLEILKRYNMEDLFNKIDLEKESNNTCIELCEYIIKNKKSPSKRSTNDEEKRLALFLQNKRQAASGKGECKIYKSDLEILKRYNMSDLFNKIDLEKESNNICIELCEYIIKNNKSPSTISINEEEKRLAKFLQNKRQAAYGKGRNKLYQSDLEILKQYNLPDLFKTRGS